MPEDNFKRSPRVTVAALCCAALFLYAVYLGALGVLLPAVGASFDLGAAALGQSPRKEREGRKRNECSGRTGEAGGRLAGTNLLWLSEQPMESETPASVRTAAGGTCLCIEYIWNYEGEAQEGIFLLGSLADTPAR